MTIVINPQANYEWKPEYFDLYQELRYKKEFAELDKEEKAALDWLTRSFTNYLLDKNED